MFQDLLKVVGAPLVKAESTDTIPAGTPGVLGSLGTPAREISSCEGVEPPSVESLSASRPAKRDLDCEEDGRGPPSPKRFRLDGTGVIVGAIAGSLATYASLAFIDF